MVISTRDWQSSARVDRTVFGGREQSHHLTCIIIPSRGMYDPVAGSASLSDVLLATGLLYVT